MEPKLLDLGLRKFPAPLTQKEREQVKLRLREQFLRDPYYSKRLEQEGDQFLETWISKGACHRGYLDDKTEKFYEPEPCPEI